MLPHRIAQVYSKLETPVHARGELSTSYLLSCSILEILKNLLPSPVIRKKYPGKDFEVSYIFLIQNEITFQSLIVSW